MRCPHLMSLIRGPFPKSLIAIYVSHYVGCHAIFHWLTRVSAVGANERTLHTSPQPDVVIPKSHGHMRSVHRCTPVLDSYVWYTSVRVGCVLQQCQQIKLLEITSDLSAQGKSLCWEGLLCSNSEILKLTVNVLPFLRKDGTRPV